MDGYLMGPVPYSNPELGLQVFKALTTNDDKKVLIKAYSRTSVRDVDKLLKSALHQSKSAGESYCQLRDVFLTQDASRALVVHIVYEKLAKITDPQWMSRDDSEISCYSGLQEYTNLKAVSVDGLLGVRELTAWADSLQCTVRITAYTIRAIEDATSLIRKALVQAAVSVSCEQNSKVFDISLEESLEDSWILSIVSEKSEGSLGKDLERRRETGKRYSDEELLRILCDMSAGLSHASKLVRSKQRTPHLDIKLENVLLCADGSVQLAWYKGNWESALQSLAKPFEAETLNLEEIQVPIQPTASIDPYKSDVYELGRFLLQVADASPCDALPSHQYGAKSETVHEEVERLSVQPGLKHLLTEMLEDEATLRVSIEQVQSEAVLLLEEWRTDASVSVQSKASDCFEMEGGGEVSEQAVLLYRKGIELKAGFHYWESRVVLQTVWNTLEKNADASNFRLEVGLALGELLCLNLSCYDDAERVLRSSLDIADRLNPASEEAAKLRIWIGALLFFSGQYKESEELCKTVLATDFSRPHNSELYWSAVYYQVYSLLRQNKDSDAVSLFENLQPLTADATILSQAKYFILHGICLRIKKDFNEAEKELQKAMEIYSSSEPSSMYSAINYMSLGFLAHYNLDRPTDAEVHYQSAERIFAVHFPRSISRAKNLSNLCVLYEGKQQYVAAECCGLCAHLLLAEYCSDCSEAAYVLATLGKLYEAMGRSEDAIQRVLQAHRMYVERCPTDTHAIINVKKLKALCLATGRNELALKCSLQLYECLASSHPTHLNTARLLLEIADYHRKVGQRDDALRRHLEADAILSLHYPAELITPMNLCSLANIYKGKNNSEEAIATRLKAHKLYLEYHSSSLETASNLGVIANIYKDMSQFGEAVEMRLEAHRLLWQHHRTKSDTPKNLTRLAMLYVSAGQAANAIRQYSFAHDLFSTNNPGSVHKGFNLFNFALCYGDLNRFAEAEIRIVATERLYLVQSIASEAKTQNKSCIRFLYEDSEPDVTSEETAQDSFDLGMAYEKLGMWESALRLVTEALSFWNESSVEDKGGLAEAACKRLKKELSARKK